MKEFSYTVSSEHGMHARPCGLLCSTAKKFDSECSVTYEGRTANAKRLISVMGLGVKQGGVMHFKIDGPDEDAAEKAILECLEEHVE